jgi:hypothetical protein
MTLPTTTPPAISPTNQASPSAMQTITPQASASAY